MPASLEQRAEAELLARSREWKDRYRDQPALFVRDCILWRDDEDGPTAYQSEILEAIPSRRRVSVRGPHGLGKTAIASWVILWFALTRDGTDWKVPTTASAWRQLTKFLWPEVRKWARRLDWERMYRDQFRPNQELLSLSLKLQTGEAFALASNDSSQIEGAHASSLLYVFDESKTIPPETWDSAEGAMASGDCYWLAISTPGEPQGRFYDIHRRRPGLEDWYVRHVTKAEAIAAGRISEEWAAARKAQWGETSAVYQNRVEGLFASGDEDGVIPLSWVEAANERWNTWRDDGSQLPDTLTSVGVDVARSGDGATSMALRYGQIVSELRRAYKEDTMKTTGRVSGILSAHGGRAVVDVIGIGAGVVDRLREKNMDVVAFNASEGTDMKDVSGELGFTNKRSAAWWNMRELLDPANDHAVALPPDDKLIGDLTAPHWRVLSGGKIQVEGKDEIRKRIGRSTDDGDAVIMAFFPEPVVAPPPPPPRTDQPRLIASPSLKVGMHQRPKPTGMP